MSPVLINGIDKQGVSVNGVQVKQALSAANETVSKGVYNATTLSAVDADLAVGNIKSGVVIFGVTGAATIQDISAANAAVGEVLSPKTFFSVTGDIKTGTMPTVALSAAANSYPAGYHVGAASLTAVDADLAAGNIKSGVVIFGVTGTYSQAAAEDVTGEAITAYTSTTAGGFYYNKDLTTGQTWDLVTKTLSYAAGSLAIAVGAARAWATDVAVTLRLLMDGVLMNEEAVDNNNFQILIGVKALSGSKICLLRAYNGHASTQVFRLPGAIGSGQLAPAGIGIGSIKVV